MKILTVPNRLLTSEAASVVEIDGAFRDLCFEMRELMLAHNGWGLAAPQVGELRRVFVMLSWPQPFVNPVLVSHGEEREVQVESCLSVPSLSVPVDRWKKVKLEAGGLDGVRRVFKLRGRDARVAQHELDHLDGKLITDSVPLSARP